MPRATLVADSESQPKVEALTTWLARWKDQLEYCSRNQGCGCCVHIYDVDAPVEALDELPEDLLASSKWGGPAGRSDRDV